MFDPFGTKELERAREQLQEATNEMIEFHNTLRLFLVALKELNNPDVDKIFNEYQVEVTVRVA